MKITYREALRQGLIEALRSDPRTFLMGEDVGSYGGTYAVSKGLLAEFGPERIRDVPLSESGFVGAGIGAALGGLRPIVEIMTVNFSLLALDQIVNSAAFYSHMSGGQINVPLVIRMSTGAGRQLAAQHSNSLEGWYAHIPGLILFAPATLEDARYGLLQALQETNPVILFEHNFLLSMQGEVQPKEDRFSLFGSKVRRPGDHLTLVTYGGTLPKSLEAAENLSSQGISVEVIDLRCLRPLDLDPIYESVKKTHRLLIVDEGWKTGSLAAEIGARVAENTFKDLGAPIARLCKKEVPVPYAKPMEDLTLPQRADIEHTVKEMIQ